MRIKLWTFCEDTEEDGTLSRVFTTREAFETHLIDLLHDWVCEPKSRKKLDRDLRDVDATVENVFMDYVDEYKRDHMDTYNFDEVSIDVPVIVQVYVSGGSIHEAYANHEEVDFRVHDEDNLKDKMNTRRRDALWAKALKQTPYDLDINS